MDTAKTEVLDRMKPKMSLSVQHRDKLSAMAEQAPEPPKQRVGKKKSRGMGKTMFLEYLVDLMWAIMPHKRKHEKILASLVKQGMSEGEALAHLLDLGAAAFKAQEKDTGGTVTAIESAPSQRKRA